MSDKKVTFQYEWFTEKTLMIPVDQTASRFRNLVQSEDCQVA